MSAVPSGAAAGSRRLRRGELIALARRRAACSSRCSCPATTARPASSTRGTRSAPPWRCCWRPRAPALALVISALTERTTALPVSTAVWCVPLGLAGVIAAIVRLLERPEAATGLAAARGSR